MELKEAIILAGGKGKRMRSVTMDKFPKGLTPIQDIPILNWEIEWLAREGINHVVLAVGYLHEMIKDSIGNKIDTKFGSVDIDYSIEKSKLGSGGAIKLATSLVSSENILIMNGDLLLNSDLNDMKAIHHQAGINATMLLIKMRSPYGVVISDGKNNITNFVEKPLLDVYIHGGVDIVNKETLNRFPKEGQMEETIFIDLVNEGTFKCFKAPTSDFWMSIDSEKDYETANKNWKGL